MEGVRVLGVAGGAGRKDERRAPCYPPQGLALDWPPCLIPRSMPASVLSPLHSLTSIHPVGKAFSSQARKLRAKKVT